MKNNATQPALFCIRASLFIFMSLWAALKVTAPASYGGSEGNPGIFENYYGVATGGNIVLILGVLQIILLVAFVLGAFKTLTYGAVALMNTVTLIVSMPLILDPFGGQPNMLFVASIPIFGASIALFLMRDQDQFLSVSKSNGADTVAVAN